MAREVTSRGALPWYEGDDTPSGHAQQKDLAETVADKAVLFDQGAIGLRPAAASTNKGMLWLATNDATFSWSTGTEWLPIPGPGLLPIGGVLDWPSTAPPPGPAVWLELNGGTIQRADYPELFSAWGAAGTSIALQHRSGRAPIGAGLGTGLAEARTVGDAIGGETVTLKPNQLPSHSHTASTAAAGGHHHNGATGYDGAHNHGYGYGGWDGTWGANDFGPVDPGQNPIYSVVRNPQTVPNGVTSTSPQHAHIITPDGAHTHTLTINPTGGGETVELMQPSIVTRYFVRAK